MASALMGQFLEAVMGFWVRTFKQTIEKNAEDRSQEEKKRESTLHVHLTQARQCASALLHHGTVKKLGLF